MQGLSELYLQKVLLARWSHIRICQLFLIPIAISISMLHMRYIAYKVYMLYAVYVAYMIKVMKAPC